MKRRIAGVAAALLLTVAWGGVPVYAQDDSAKSGVQFDAAAFEQKDTSEKESASKPNDTNTTNDPQKGTGGTAQVGNDEGATDPPVTPASLKPNVLVSDYNFGGDSVVGGQTFTFQFTLFNTSKNIAMKNMVVKLGGGDVFAQASGTDTLYIENIAAQKAVSRTMDFTAALNAATGGHPITISVSYEYYDNDVKSEGTAELSVSVPVVQKDKIQINNLKFDTAEIYTNEDYGVNYGIINSGFTKLYNATAKLLDEAGNQLGTVYLGTVEPGTEVKSNGDLMTMFTEAGEKKLIFKLTYEDEAMQPQELTQELTATVTEMVSNFPIEEPLPEEPEPTGPSPLLIGGIIAAVVLVGGGTTAILLVRRRKKQRSMEEDEDI